MCTLAIKITIIIVRATPLKWRMVLGGGISMRLLSGAQRAVLKAMSPYKMTKYRSLGGSCGWKYLFASVLQPTDALEIPVC